MLLLVIYRRVYEYSARACGSGKRCHCTSNELKMAHLYISENTDISTTDESVSWNCPNLPRL